MSAAQYTFTFKAMGSRCELSMYARSSTEAERIFELAQKEVQRFEHKYSRYRTDSVTSQINAHAGSGKALAVDSETAQLLNYAHALFEQSEGLFDVTSGVLRKAWNFNSGVCPSDADLAPLLPLIGWSKVEWDGAQVGLPRPGMEIDLGGFVKEYAADVVAMLCRSEGVEHGFANLGGDIRIIGPHPDGSPWRVGIQHPREDHTAIIRVDVHRGAIATSGDYERFMLVDGQRYSHLLDPRTGRSLALNFSSVSVIADLCVLAGSFSTIAMLKSVSEPHWLHDSDLAYVIIDQQMKLSGSLLTGQTTSSQA